MKMRKKLIIGTVAGILLTFVSSLSAFAEEVPAEYKEFWDMCQQRAVDIGGPGFVYDSSLLEMAEEIEELRRFESEFIAGGGYKDESKSIEEALSEVEEAKASLAEKVNREQLMTAQTPREGSSVSLTIGSSLITIRRAVVYKSSVEGMPLQLFGSRLPNDGSDYWRLKPSGGGFAGNLGMQYIENGVAVQEGWRQIGSKGAWFYFKDGEVSDGSKPIDGKYYFFDFEGLTGTAGMITNQWWGNRYYGSDGAMLVNTVTPDGYKVGSDGVKTVKVEARDSSAYAQPSEEGRVREVVEAINSYRQSNGKPALIWSPQLTAVYDPNNRHEVEGGSFTSWTPSDYGFEILNRMQVTIPVTPYTSDQLFGNMHLVELGNNLNYMDGKDNYNTNILLGDFKYIGATFKDVYQSAGCVYVIVANFKE